MLFGKSRDVTFYIECWTDIEGKGLNRQTNQTERIQWNGGRKQQKNGNECWHGIAWPLQVFSKTRLLACSAIKWTHKTICVIVHLCRIFRVLPSNGFTFSPVRQNSIVAFLGNGFKLKWLFVSFIPFFLPFFYSSICHFSSFTLGNSLRKYKAISNNLPFQSLLLHFNSVKRLISHLSLVLLVLVLLFSSSPLGLMKTEKKIPYSEFHLHLNDFVAVVVGCFFSLFIPLSIRHVSSKSHEYFKFSAPLATTIAVLQP